MDLKRAIEDEGVENSENGSKRVKMNSDDEEEEIDFSDDELLVPILPTEVEVRNFTRYNFDILTLAGQGFFHPM